MAFLLAVTVLVVLVRSALEPQPAASPAPPPTETAPAETEEEPSAGTEPAGTGAEAEVYYTIEAGDTLESIAAGHDTTVERLLDLNPGIDPVALTVGQRIRVA